MDGVMLDWGNVWLWFDQVIGFRAFILCFKGSEGLAIVGS